MSTNETYYPDLITRYFSGEATPEEICELSSWVNSDQANASVFNENRKSWLAMTAYQVDEQMDVDQEWRELQKKFSQEREQELSILVTKEFPPIEEDAGKLIRMEPEGIDWRITLIRVATIAAIVLVLLVPTWIVYRYFTTTDSTKITAANEIIETTLPDGTIVTLNAYASISYTGDFGKETREVELRGEGYFDVVRDLTKPFIISSGHARIEVLGTAFYINAMKNEGDIEVVLVEGSLSVYFEDIHGEGKILIPGEKAELIQANRRIVVSPNENPNFLAWKTHRMIFLDDRLDVIVQTLNKVYQANIRLASEGLAACRLTASFNRQSLESVLSVIQATLDLRTETTSSEIILYGAGCN